MNKGEFLRAVANEAGTTIKEATAVYDAYTKVVYETLAKDQKIALVGFGTYEAKKKPARTCTNPMTGAKVKVAACKAPTFKFGKAFKDSLN
ncbi:MAG: HU family DNA-binding protein [bacterium]|nr:HU family DNA-binding protein [Clostridia bacterium]MCR5553880.1 HU family DNA-binding protein [bacterium]